MRGETLAGLLKLAGKFCFVMAVLSFLGILDYIAGGDKSAEALAESMLGEALFWMLDWQTILWAGASLLIGLILSGLTTEPEAAKSGHNLIVASILCIILTFTPLSLIAIVPNSLAVVQEQYSPDGYVEMSFDQENSKMFAFLGSDKSTPFDVDIMEYIMNDYHGTAQGEYKKYKICGQLHNFTQSYWHNVVLEFVLVDENGNDILRDGEPVVLYSGKDFESDLTVGPGLIGTFETNVVKAKELSATPYGFRVQSVRQATFEDVM